MRPTVSVLIANYNYANYVGAAIESALKQDEQALEVIVVDDGSKDHSREVISQYSGIHAIFQENAGHVAAAKRGLDEAKGEIVIFLDADDELLPEAIKTIVDSWQDGLLGLQYRLAVFGSKGESGETLPKGAFDKGDAQERFRKVGSITYSPTSGCAFDRDFADRVFTLSSGLVKSSFDMWLCFAAVVTGKFVSLDMVLARYRIHDANMSRPNHVMSIADIQHLLFCAWHSQQSAFTVARTYGVSIETPPDILGPYFQKWYLLLRGAPKNKWRIPEQAKSRVFISAVRSFAHLKSDSPVQLLGNLVLVTIFSAAPRSLRRLIAVHVYNYKNDVDF